MPTLAEIHVYPVKSCRGIPLSEARVTASGIEWDRRWMFVDAAGTFISQRTHPQLARIETRLADDAVELDGPEAGVLRLPFAEHGRATAVRVWKDHCEALDAGPEAAQWARTAAGADVRLVRAGRITERHANPQFAGSTHAPMGFADAYPILVVNLASLEELNRRMPEPIPIGRFRPNLVLEGLEPFAEDHIDTIVIGELTLRLVKACTRCIVTSTDQQSGRRSTDPLPVLRQFRFDRALLGVTFGENAVVERGAGARIQRGAACRI